MYFFITYCVHYAMIKRKAFFFTFRHYVQNAIVTEKEIWFLLNHCYDYVTIMKKLFFCISLGRSLWKYLLTWSFIAHYITNLLKKFPDGIVPGKSMCNLKNFFLRNFSGVLHDLLPAQTINFKLCTHISNRLLHKTVPAFY